MTAFHNIPAIAEPKRESRKPPFVRAGHEGLLSTILRSFVKMLRFCMVDHDAARFDVSVKKLVKHKPMPEKPE